MFGGKVSYQGQPEPKPDAYICQPVCIVSLSPHREQALDGLLAQELQRCRLVAVHGDDGEGFILERSERAQRREPWHEGSVSIDTA